MASTSIAPLGRSEKREPARCAVCLLPGDSEQGIEGMSEFVKSRVAKYYWEDDINCATTSLKILSEKFGVDLSDQVVDAAVGMHGAGEYGAQCGLVEGALMFLGISGRRQHIPDEAIVRAALEADIKVA